jgi:tetratricopeptide (TPR) repeat protein
MSLLAGGFLIMADGRAVAEGERKDFLSHGPGAAQDAMGESVTALADDVTAIYYNPAGLPYQSIALHAEHTPVFDGGRYNFIGLNYPSRIGAFGFGIIQYAVDGIEGRQNIGDEPTDLSATQTAWYIPYSYKWKYCSLGSALKVVDMNLGGAHGAGWGVDFGALYRRLLNDTKGFKQPTFQAGISVKNLIEPTYTLVEDPETLPRDYKFGMAFTGFTLGRYSRQKNEMVYDRITIASDFAKTPGQQGLISYGIQYSIWDLFPLRMGYSDHLSLGIGYGCYSKPVAFDYSMALTGLGVQHRFSFEYRFSVPVPQAPSLQLISPELYDFQISQKDSDRYRDRFIEKGRSSLNERRYEEALNEFEKAHILDLGSEQIRNFLTRAREGKEQAFVKEKLDLAKKSLNQGDYQTASQSVLQALAVPRSPELKTYLSIFRSQLNKLGQDAIVYFESLREKEMTRIDGAYQEAIRAKDIQIAQDLVDCAATLAPDHPVSVRLTAALPQDRLKIVNSFLTDAGFDASEGKVEESYTDLLRAKEAGDSPLVAQRLQETQSFYDSQHTFSSYENLYQEQLYNRAALHYVKEEYQDCLQDLTTLLEKNAVHEQGQQLKLLLIKKKILQEAYGHETTEVTTIQNAGPAVFNSDGVGR